MQLSYRGSKYQYKRQSSPITVHSNEITGKYRGAEFKAVQDRMFSGMRSPVTLKYRGVSYHLGANSSND